MKKSYVVWALLLVPVVIPGCKVAPLQTPYKFTVSAQPDKVEAAIKRGLANRGWIITDQSPGEINATLLVREHKAVIRIHYNAEEVVIDYVDSENLNYAEKKNGQRVIHGNFNSWVNNLARDIQVFMQA